MKWRNPYDQATNEQLEHALAIDFTEDPGRTLQAPAEEQDINVIMQRFGIKDGSVLPRWQDAAAIYGDFSEIPSDPVEAAEAIRLGNQTFMTLPAEIRTRFHSPGQLYHWLSDTNNKDEAVKLGLLSFQQPQLVSTSTSSDKEPLVQTAAKPAETSTKENS